MSDALRTRIEQATKALVDEGKLIEAGWLSMRMLAVPVDASDVQLRELRTAFFAGAQHVFSSIMTFLDECEEPTEDDLKRIDQVNEELKRFVVEFEATLAAMQ